MFHWAGLNVFASHSSAFMSSGRLGVYLTSPIALGIWPKFFFLIRLSYVNHKT